MLGTEQNKARDCYALESRDSGCHQLHCRLFLNAVLPLSKEFTQLVVLRTSLGYTQRHIGVRTQQQTQFLVPGWAEWEAFGSALSELTSKTDTQKAPFSNPFLGSCPVWLEHSRPLLLSQLPRNPALALPHSNPSLPWGLHPLIFAGLASPCSGRRSLQCMLVTSPTYCWMFLGCS